MIYGFASRLGDISFDWESRRCSRLFLEGCGFDDGENPVSVWLSSYFEGHALPLPPIAPPKTPFQGRLRKALLEIPFGETRTYGELARTLHTAPRALGQALGANPLPLLIPCHRVVGANGIGGFSCGIEWKQALLEFERNS